MCFQNTNDFVKKKNKKTIIRINLSFAITFYLFEEGCGKVASLDGHISQHSFLIGFLQNILLHGALADQPKNGHWNEIVSFVCN